MPTVAEQLRFAREAQGYTVHQIAEITKIKTEHIRALEAGDYGIFAAPVYVRGFARTYAKLLRLEPEEVVAAIDAELRNVSASEERPLMAPRNQGLVDALMLQFSKVNWRIVMPLLGVALALVVAIVAYRAYATYRDRDPLFRLGPGLYEPRGTDEAEILPLPAPPPSPPAPS
jgi:cytoskeleton protein RodZ